MRFYEFEAKQVLGKVGLQVGLQDGGLLDIESLALVQGLFVVREGFRPRIRIWARERPRDKIFKISAMMPMVGEE